MAQTALDGHFHDYQLRNMVEGDRATINDDRFTLVGMDRYVAAGGRVSSDLFGELPDCLLDPEVLQAAWRERVQPIADRLTAGGLAVYVGRDAGFGVPDGFFRLQHVWERDLGEDQVKALADARYEVTRLSSELQEGDEGYKLEVVATVTNDNRDGMVFMGVVNGAGPERMDDLRWPGDGISCCECRRGTVLRLFAAARGCRTRRHVHQRTDDTGAA